MSRERNRTEMRSTPRPGGPGEFKPDYRYVFQDLRRIGLLAAGLLIALVALSFFLD